MEWGRQVSDCWWPVVMWSWVRFAGAAAAPRPWRVPGNKRAAGVPANPPRSRKGLEQRACDCGYRVSREATYSGNLILVRAARQGVCGGAAAAVGDGPASDA